jgi:hypothetical protein
VFDPNQISDALFKFPYIGPLVGQPPSIQQIADARQEALPVANVGPTDVQLLVKGRFTAKDRQIIEL